jgi:Cell division protein FtsL.
MQAVQRKTAYETHAAPQPRSRVVKIEGNVAYINNGFAENKAKPAAKPAAKAAAKPVAKPAARLKTGLVSTLLMAIVAFAAMALLVSRYAEASAVGVQNNDLKASITAVETQIEALKVDIEMKDDLLYVQQTAQQELNMTYPSPDQMIEIKTGG